MKDAPDDVIARDDRAGLPHEDSVESAWAVLGGAKGRLRRKDCAACRESGRATGGVRIGARDVPCCVMTIRVHSNQTRHSVVGEGCVHAAEGDCSRAAAPENRAAERERVASCRALFVESFCRLKGARLFRPVQVLVAVRGNRLRTGTDRTGEAARLVLGSYGSE